MNADGGILGCDARLPRQFAELAIFKIDDLKRVSILGPQSREKAGNTTADLMPQHGLRLLTVGGLSAPGLHSACRGGPVTVIIGERVAEDPIEPGHHVLILHTRPSLESARERRLQNVFGVGSGSNPPFEECQKLAVCSDQLCCCLGRQ